jgi:hypothetical protein
MEEIRMRILMCVGALSLAAAGAIQAQGGTARLPAGNAIGVTVDRFQVEDFHLMAATFHLSSLQPNAFTPEFAISVFPQAFAAGILATNIDVGGAINLSLPRASLLLRGGLSGLFAMGSGGAAALPGIHYGASLLVKIAGGSGIRFDAIARRAVLPPYGVSPAYLSLGVGITSLPVVH